MQKRSAADLIQGQANFPPLKNTSQDTPTSVTRVFFKADFFPKAVGEEGTLLGRFLGSLFASSSWVSQSIVHPVHPSGDKKKPMNFMNLDIIWYFPNLNFRAYCRKTMASSLYNWGLVVSFKYTVGSTAGIERGTLCWSTCLPIAMEFCTTVLKIISSHFGFLQLLFSHFTMYIALQVMNAKIGALKCRESIWYLSLCNPPDVPPSKQRLPPGVTRMGKQIRQEWHEKYIVAHLLELE